MGMKTVDPCVVRRRPDRLSERKISRKTHSLVGQRSWNLTEKGEEQAPEGHTAPVVSGTRKRKVLWLASDSERRAPHVVFPSPVSPNPAAWTPVRAVGVRRFRHAGDAGRRGGWVLPALGAAAVARRSCKAVCGLFLDLFLGRNALLSISGCHC